jgi:hypothetical protein
MAHPPNVKLSGYIPRYCIAKSAAAKVAFLRRVKPALLKPAVVVVLGAYRLQQQTNNLYKLCYKKIFMGILPL